MLCDIINEFIDKIDNCEAVEEKHKIILEGWEEVFSEVLKEIGVKDTKILFEWGKGGYNWARLHPTEIQKNQSLCYAIDSFRWELFYCSDRMSLDRLFRCHWLYNHLNGLNKEV